MNDIIVVGIILFLVVLAILYIRKEKKGNKCVGCPSAGSCHTRSGCPQKQDHQDK